MPTARYANRSSEVQKSEVQKYAYGTLGEQELKMPEFRSDRINYSVTSATSVTPATPATSIFFFLTS
jgi:hypothetical protein